MRFPLMIAAAIGISLQTSMDCARLCDSLVVSGCQSDPVCESGVCVPLFWTREDREEIVEGEGEIALRVTCEEASSREVSKRRRTDDPGEAATPPFEGWQTIARILELRVAFDTVRAHLLDSGLLEALSVYPFGLCVTSSSVVGLREAIHRIASLFEDEEDLTIVQSDEDIIQWQSAIWQIATLPLTMPDMNWLSEEQRRFAYEQIRSYELFSLAIQTPIPLLPADDDVWGVAAPRPSLRPRMLFPTGSWPIGDAVGTSTTTSMPGEFQTPYEVVSASTEDCVTQAEDSVALIVGTDGVSFGAQFEAMNKVRKCRRFLSVHSRRLLALHTALQLLDADETIISVDHSAEQMITALRGLSRAELIRGVDIRINGSEAYGDGVRVSLVAAALKDLFASALFRSTDDRAQFLRPSDLSADEEEAKAQLDRYRQVGRLVGLAVRDRRTVPGFLSSGILAILRDPLRREPVAASDLTRWLEQEDPVMVRSLRRAVSEPESWPLLEFPDDTPVTAENVATYVEAHARHALIESIARQAHMMALGLYDVIPFGQLGWLSIDELRELLEPPRVIDRTTLKASITSEAPEGAPEVGWFVEIVDELTEEELRQFLRFVSGSSDLPIQGIGAGRNWLQLVVADSLTFNGLPRAQTCFTQLSLPRYASKEILRTRLLYAIHECNTLELK